MRFSFGWYNTEEETDAAIRAVEELARMRERKTWLVVTFHTTAAAIGMEKLCAARGLAGRLIPVPRALTADCGMAWRAEIDRRAALEALAAGEGLEVEGFYELTL